MKFTTGHTGGQVRVWRNHHLLLSVVLCFTLPQVLGFLGSRVVVAVVQVIDDTLVEVLNFLFKWRKALDLAGIHLYRELLRRNFVFNWAFYGRHRNVANATVVQPTSKNIALVRVGNIVFQIDSSGFLTTSVILVALRSFHL